MCSHSIYTNSFAWKRKILRFIWERTNRGFQSVWTLRHFSLGGRKQEPEIYKAFFTLMRCESLPLFSSFSKLNLSMCMIWKLYNIFNFMGKMKMYLYENSFHERTKRKSRKLKQKSSIHERSLPLILIKL